MTKKNLMPVIVLTAICIIVAALLGLVNYFTEPEIRDRNEKEIQASLTKVMPDGLFNAEPDELENGAPKTITKVYTEKSGKGTVVVLETNKGYTGKPIGLTVGIDGNGKITGMVITRNEESIVPAELMPGGTYGNHYVGISAKELPELSTGATVVFTESAIKGAIRDAFVYLGFEKELPDLPRKEAEITSLAKEFYGEGAEKLESYTAKGTTYLKRFYKEDGKSSYVAYAFAYSPQYGTPEFEVLVHVDENGTITNIKKVLWKVSDPKPEWGYIPPTDAEVDALFNSFIGTGVSSAGSVDVECGATNTSNRLRDAIVEAVSIDVTEESQLPRITAIVIFALAAVTVATAIILKKQRRAVRK